MALERQVGNWNLGEYRDTLYSFWEVVIKFPSWEGGGFVRCLTKNIEIPIHKYREDFLK